MRSAPITTSSPRAHSSATSHPQAQYAVRGELVIRAMSHAEALRRGEPRPFEKLTVRGGARGGFAAMAGWTLRSPHDVLNAAPSLPPPPSFAT